jgi:hypothetical protein
MDPTSSSPALREQLRKTTLYGGLTLAAVALVVAARIIPYLADNAYVTFRTADNLASGLGFRFNHYLPPVDGSASTLWLLLLTPVARALGASRLPSAAILFGIVAFAGSIPVALRIGRLREEKNLGAGVAGRLLPAALWCLSASAILAAVTGSGAMLFVVLVLLVHGALSGAIPGWAAWLAAVLVPWAAPDGALIILAAGAQFLVDGNARKERGRRFLVLSITLLLSLVALEFAGHRVFDSWWPNWFVSHPQSLHGGWHALRRALVMPSVLAPLIAGVAGSLFGEARHRGYLAAAIVWLGTLFLSSSDSPGSALQLQILPALALSALAAGGLARLADQERSGAVGRVIAWAALPLCLDLVAIPFSLQSIAQVDVPVREEQLDLMRWLEKTPASYVATADAGVLGFHMPGLDFVDFRGEVGPRDTDYMFLARAPQFLIVRLRLTPLRDAAGKLMIPPALAASPEERQVLEDPRFARRYRLFVVANQSTEHGYARAIYRNVVFDESLLRRPVGDLIDLPPAQ